MIIFLEQRELKYRIDYGGKILQKFGYDYKNGVNEIDDEQLYRLEKFR